MSSLPATMSGVQLVGHGGPDMLVWRDDLPVPHPASGEVLVRVLAAGVNMTDINTRIGWYGQGEGRAAGLAAGWAGAMAFPRIQGGDLCAVCLNELTLYGCTHQPREVFTGLVTIINTARIRPVVSKTYPLRDTAQAQADLAAGRFPGKLVLVPSEPQP